MQVSERQNGKRLHKRDRKQQSLAGAALVAGASASVFVYSYFREPLRIQLDRLTFRIPNSRGRLPDSGLRILHLSDTHFRGANWREHPKIRQIRRICSAFDYDILVHTGDFVHTDQGMENALLLLDQLPKPRIASFAVFGNHDYMKYSAREMFSRSWATFQQMDKLTYPNGRRRDPISQTRRYLAFFSHFANAPLDLRRTGANDTKRLENELRSRDIEVLHNRHIRLNHRTNGSQPIDLYIAGVDDLTEGAPSLELALSGIPRTDPTLLLSHNPDVVGQLGIDQADLVLSGHTHGGQIVLPWVGALHTHTEFLTRAEVSGYMRRGVTQIYISRGIGEGIPLRFAASPQIALLTLLPS